MAFGLGRKKVVDKVEADAIQDSDVLKVKSFDSSGNRTRPQGSVEREVPKTAEEVAFQKFYDEVSKHYGSTVPLEAMNGVSLWMSEMLKVNFAILGALRDVRDELQLIRNQSESEGGLDD